MNIVTLISTYGYLIVGSLVAIENVGVPVPGELALITAAAFAAQGQLSIVGVIVASTVGTILGGSGGYWLGRTGGLALLGRYGHWIGFNDAKLANARAYFFSHGAKTVIIARFIGILRILAGILAGVAHMSFGLFTMCNALGGVLWSIAFGVLGYVFGENLPQLRHYVHRAGIAAVVAVVLGVVGFFVWRRYRNRQPPSI